MARRWTGGFRADGRLKRCGWSTVSVNCRTCRGVCGCVSVYQRVCMSMSMCVCV